MSGRRRRLTVVDSDDDDDDYKKVHDDDDDTASSPIVLVPKLCDIGQELLVDIMEQNDPKKLGKAMKGLVLKIRRQYQEDNESDTRTVLHRLGGHVIATSKMKNHLKDPIVQHFGIGMLNGVSMVSMLAADRDIIKAGGVEAIVNAMNHHKGDEDLYVEALCALRNVTRHACNSDATVVTTTANRLVEEYDVVSIVNAAMKAYPLNGGIQLNSCVLLDNLASCKIVMSNKKNKKKLLQAVASVGTALQTYGDKLLCVEEETAAPTTTTSSSSSSDRRNHSPSRSGRSPPQDSSTKKRKRSNDDDDDEEEEEEEDIEDIENIVKYGGRFMKKMFPSSH